MSSVVRFVSTMLHSREQAHIFHLQTGSYAKHIALKEYYEGIVGLVDEYVEAYQGRYGVLRGYEPVARLYDDSMMIKYFDGLLAFLDGVKQELPDHGDLGNLVDEITALVSSTIYKLKTLD